MTDALLHEVTAKITEALQSVQTLVETVGETSSEDLVEQARASDPLSNERKEESQMLMFAVQGYQKAVSDVCSILRDEIEKIPPPTKITTAPYLETLANENLKEAAAIRYLYEKEVKKL